MISIVLPTYNEAANIVALLTRLAEIFPHDSEFLVVDDDSPDGTWRIAQEYAANHSTICVIRRQGRRGLASAVVEGFCAAQGDILLVMDADLQHDPSVAQSLVEAIQSGAVLSVASRYREGGSVGDWIRGRRIASRIATTLSQKLPSVRVTDPMSGYFALRRDAFDRIRTKLWPVGFKILLEILAFLPRESCVSEVPLRFLPRERGESKLNWRVEGIFLLQILRILMLRIIGKIPCHTEGNRESR